MKILLTASSGGHLEQLKQLSSLCQSHEVKWLVCDNAVNRSMQNVEFMPEYRNETKIRRFFDFFRIYFKSKKVIKSFKPDVVISTGAGATFPVCYIQKKKMKKKVIFIESFAKRTSPTKTGKQVYKFADHFIVQWEEMKEFYPNAIVGGMIY